MKAAAKPRKRHPIEKADLAVAETAGQWRDRPIVKLLGKASELADQPQLYTLCGATIALGLVRGDRRLRNAGLRMLAAQWLATTAKTAVKRQVDRTRPAVPLDGGAYRMERGHSHDKPLNSFPSGHTAGAFAVATAFASEYPEHKVAVHAAAASAALIQIPRCAHFPSDLGVGAAIGLTAGGLVAKVD